MVYLKAMCKAGMFFPSSNPDNSEPIVSISWRIRHSHCGRQSQFKNNAAWSGGVKLEGTVAFSSVTWCRGGT